MNIINNGNSFLLLKYRLTFAAGIKNKIDVMNAIIGKKNSQFPIRIYLMPYSFFGRVELLCSLILWYMRCVSHLQRLRLTDSIFSVWTIRLQPALYRYPAILFPN